MLSATLHTTYFAIRTSYFAPPTFYFLFLTSHFILLENVIATGILSVFLHLLPKCQPYGLVTFQSNTLTNSTPRNLIEQLVFTWQTSSHFILCNRNQYPARCCLPRFILHILQFALPTSRLLLLISYFSLHILENVIPTGFLSISYIFYQKASPTGL